MTVEPGFGGQSFIPKTLDKISLVRSFANSSGRDVRIQVDGGINGETAKLVKEAGADVLVSGSYLLKSQNMSETVKMLKSDCKTNMICR